MIQVTEALTVIDVNSGKNVRKKGDDESTLKMNLEAAKEQPDRYVFVICLESF